MNKEKRAKGATHASIAANVLPIMPFCLSLIPLKQRYSLSSSALFLLPVIAYYGARGVSPTALSKLLHGNSDGYRSVCFRLSALRARGLVVNGGGRWRLSGEGLRALSAVVVEGEGAKFLAEVERKRLAAEKRAAAKLERLRAKNG